MSSGKPIIAVCGATGLQGGSVAKFLLEDGSFAVRALTRKPDGDAAKALVKQGAEVVSMNLDDPASIDAAFKGVYGVFGLTNFWEHFEGERDQGKRLADASKKAGVKHFVWSSLDSVTLKSGQKCPHWETKNDIYEYTKSIGVPYTNFITSFYFENIITFYALKRTADGVELGFGIPGDVKMAGFSVRDMGGWALHFFKNPEQWINKELKVATEFVSLDHMASVLSEVLGEKVVSKAPSTEQFLNAKQDELWLNMKIFEENQGPPLRDIQASLKAYPGALDFKGWAQKYKDELLARTAK